MPKVSVIGFRGTGNFKSPKYRDKPGLIKAGHVGIQLEGDKRIFGFSPAPKVIEAVGGEDKLLELLLEHNAQIGTIQDDTTIFELAYQLHQKGERTEVIVWEQDLTEKEFEAIQNDLLDWFESQKTYLYNLPFEDGTFEKDQCNCAIFPKLLGITIPSENGNLRVYLETMREKGAKLWQAPNK
jgi:hypothetical protein